jgi:hypothetical protein
VFSRVTLNLYFLNAEFTQITKVFMFVSALHIPVIRVIQIAVIHVALTELVSRSVTQLLYSIVH